MNKLTRALTGLFLVALSVLITLLIIAYYEQPVSYDLNKDGKINIIDVQILINQILNTETEVQSDEVVCPVPICVCGDCNVTVVCEGCCPCCATPTPEATEIPNQTPSNTRYILPTSTQPIFPTQPTINTRPT
jgi:hypothetical protein